MAKMDQAILLTVAKAGKSKLLIEVLARRQGRCHAMISLEDASAPKFLLPGCYLDLSITPDPTAKVGQAKLEGVSGGIIADDDEDIGISALSSVKDLSTLLLDLNEPMPEIFDRTKTLMHSLIAEDQRWPLHYAAWEFAVMCELGYVTGIERCLADHRAGEVIYMAKKSGKVFTRIEAGAFLDRMVTVPSFLMGAKNASPVEVKQAMELNEHLIESFALPAAGGTEMPVTRKFLAKVMAKIRNIPTAQSAGMPEIDEDARQQRLATRMPLMVARKAVTG